VVLPSEGRKNKAYDVEVLIDLFKIVNRKSEIVNLTVP
jgi:hypothetical protein